MMSKFRRSVVEKTSASALSRTNWTPDPPGPPGFTMSDPILPFGSVEGQSRIEMFR